MRLFYLYSISGNSLKYKEDQETISYNMVRMPQQCIWFIIKMLCSVAPDLGSPSVRAQLVKKVLTGLF